MTATITLPLDDVKALALASANLVAALRELDPDLAFKLLDAGVGTLVGDLNDAMANLTRFIKAQQDAGGHVAGPMVSTAVVRTYHEAVTGVMEAVFLIEVPKAMRARMLAALVPMRTAEEALRSAVNVAIGAHR